jgi:hypothetical protein
MRMPQSSNDLNLAKESLGAYCSAEVRLEDLERNGPIVANVAREIYLRHAAAPDLPLDFVLSAQCLRKLGVTHVVRWPVEKC